MRLLSNSESRKCGRRMTGFGRCLCGLLLAVVVAWPAMAAAKERAALVIGNNDYRTLPDLRNARVDARDIAAKLNELGFDVVLKMDAGRRELSRALADFEGRLAGAEVGLLFYAGHGIASGGQNWLIPSDARIEVEADLMAEGIEMSEFTRAMERAGSDLNIVIIDACRDNPLPRRTRSASRGLVVEPVRSGPSGTAIMYSAAPGQTAQDGPPGGHGVFTGALLRYLDEPGLKLEDVFKKTAAAVFQTTGGTQDPWFHSSVKRDFAFREGGPRVARLTPPGDAPSGDRAGKGSSGNAQTAEFIYWQSIADSDDPEMFRAYLKRYPKGQFADLARIKVAKLAEPREERRDEPRRRPRADPTPPPPGDLLTDRWSIREVQRRLNGLGYAAGPVDGLMGAATRRAIAAYERSKGLRVRGEPTKSLLASLRAGQPRAEPRRRTTPTPDPGPAGTHDAWRRAIERHQGQGGTPQTAPPPRQTDTTGRRMQDGPGTTLQDLWRSAIEQQRGN